MALKLKSFDFFFGIVKGHGGPNIILLKLTLELNLEVNISNYKVNRLKKL